MVINLYIEFEIERFFYLKVGTSANICLAYFNIIIIILEYFPFKNNISYYLDYKQVLIIFQVVS